MSQRCFKDYKYHKGQFYFWYITTSASRLEYYDDTLGSYNITEVWRVKIMKPTEFILLLMIDPLHEAKFLKPLTEMINSFSFENRLLINRIMFIVLI